MTEEIDDPDALLGRMDFVTEVVDDRGKVTNEDGEFHRFGFRMVPNPDRYDRVDDSEEGGWLDTMDNVFIPDDVLADAWEDTDRIPLYHSPPEISDFDQYLKDRYQDLCRRLETGDIIYNFQNQSTTVLEDLSDRDNPFFVILVVDLVGSTNMSIKMAPMALSTFLHTFINEVRLLVNKHRGFVLKYTGDGLIAYFPEPNITGKHDNAILCANRLQEVVNHAINPAYAEYDLPEVQWRVGMDTGSPDIFPGAQGTRDLLGTSVSFAAKLEAAANTNEILLGDYTERNLHTDWRKRTVEVTDERGWEYERGGEEYPIYKLMTENSE